MYICTIRSRDVRRVVRRGADSRVPRADEAAVVTKHPETLRDGEPCATAVRCVCTVAPTSPQLDQTWTRERVCVGDTHTHARARAHTHTHREREREPCGLPGGDATHHHSQAWRSVCIWRWMFDAQPRASVMFEPRDPCSSQTSVCHKRM